MIEPLETALDELDGGAIPNFYVSSEEQLAALSAYAASHQKLTDAAVISPDAELIKAAKTAMPYFRAALDFSSADSFRARRGCEGCERSGRDAARVVAKTGG